MEAGYALSRYNAVPWSYRIDVPTSVVVTLEDRAIPARIQRAMASRIPDSRIFTLREWHVACSLDSFAKPLVAACRDAALRAFPLGQGSH